MAGTGAGTEAEALPRQFSPARTTWPPPLLRDVVKGGGPSSSRCWSWRSISWARKGPLEAGWTAVGIAIAGAAVAEWWKYGLTRSHLTAAEVFQDMLATGLLAASASTLVILQAPAAWSELFLLSQTVAAAAALVYHAANAYRLASSGRHLGAGGAVVLIGTPFVIGGLTLLESGGLLQALGGALAARTLTSRPEATRVPGTGVRHLLLQRGGGQRPRSGNETIPARVAQGTRFPGRRRGRRDLGCLGCLPRLKRDSGIVAGRSAAVCHHHYHRPFPGRAMGRGLSDHRDAHGRDSRAGTLAEIRRRSILFAGMKKGMVYSGVFMGLPARLGCSGTCRSSAGPRPSIR